MKLPWPEKVVTRGFDAESLEFVDMIQAGIIDPTKAPDRAARGRVLPRRRSLRPGGCRPPAGGSSPATGR